PDRRGRPPAEDRRVHRGGRRVRGTPPGLDRFLITNHALETAMTYSEQARNTEGRSAAPSAPKIRRRMGPFELALFVVAAAGPLLVVAGFAPLAFMIGGIGAPGAQLIAGIVLLLFAVGLTRMALRIKNAGAFYSYIGQGLGRPAGGGAATLAATAYSVIAIGQLGAVGAFAVVPVKDAFGIDVPWPVFSFTAFAIVAYLGHRQISLSAKVLGVALLLEAAILLVLAAPVLWKGGAEGFDLDSFAPTAIFAGGGT